MIPEPGHVRRMFGRTARRYDLINSLLSLGQHQRWKRLAAQACRVAAGALALDVCAGTADIAIALARAEARAVALDFSGDMLAIGRAKASGHTVACVEGDALHLPFPDDAFEAAAIGFSLRNVASLPTLLGEMARVVRPGGWVVSLETSRPPVRAVRAVYHAYLRLAAALAPVLSDGQAYRYLADTIIAFLPAEEVAELFRAAGLREVSFKRLLFGAVAIHLGQVVGAGGAGPVTHDPRLRRDQGGRPARRM